MKRVEKYIYTVIITILIISFSGCDRHEHQYSVPNCTLPDIYGNEVHLYGYLSQGPVVFVPWALWCKMCIKELDALLPYGDTLHSMHIAFFAISQDRARSVEHVLPFTEAHGWVSQYTILLDTANIIRDLYDIDAMPTTIAIDMDGNIVYRHEGYTAGDEVGIVDTLKMIFGE